MAIQNFKMQHVLYDKNCCNKTLQVTISVDGKSYLHLIIKVLDMIYIQQLTPSQIHCVLWLQIIRQLLFEYFILRSSFLINFIDFGSYIILYDGVKLKEKKDLFKRHLLAINMIQCWTVRSLSSRNFKRLNCFERQQAITYKNFVNIVVDALII